MLSYDDSMHSVWHHYRIEWSEGGSWLELWKINIGHRSSAARNEEVLYPC